MLISLCCLLAADAFFLVVAIHRASGPVPAFIRKDVKFTVYFPNGSPSGYTALKSDIAYSNSTGTLQIPLNNPAGHSVTITEQAAPGGLPFSRLQGQGTFIDGAQGQAAISNVEGRNVASMISSDHKTLIFINTKHATQEELTSLTRSLQPLR
jgi:hypothetical protein